MRRSTRLLVIPLFLFMGCGDPAGDGPYGHGGDASPIDPSTFDFCAVQTHLYEGSGCLDCHSAAAAVGSFVVEGEAGYDQVVGVASIQAPSLTQVIPGDADNSYLLAKIIDTHKDLGGNGGAMPPGGTVDEFVIEGTRIWINNGAERACNDGSTPVPTTPTATPTAEPTPEITPTPDPEATPEPTAAPYTYEQVQWVWNNSCGGCHLDEGNAGNLNLSGDSHGKIVGVASTQVPSLNLIEPWKPAESYLWLKLTDAHSAAGGTGGYMPSTGLLDDDTLAGIEGWILAGAPE